ncbi:hypothetical protein LV779_10485 [Streptomyces thinghirensis]|nr:hypothetical protein [Streptomyces thinghirensis]
MRAEAEQRAAPVRRGRLARAAHPADVRTRPRRPVPVRGGQRARERERHLAPAARRGGPDVVLLLDDLLLLARLDAPRWRRRLRWEDADLTELVRQAADAFRAGHPEHPLTVTAGPRW